MENSDLIATTSYGKNDGGNTITSIQLFTYSRYTSKISETQMQVRIAHMYQFSFRKVPLGRKTEKKTDYKFGKYF